jgi:uncharacterized protein involved in high-affinity Fe2+ transport
MGRCKILLGALASFAIVVTQPAFAAETSIGQPVVIDGIILHPVYLQPVHMAPELPGMAHGTFDAHLELDAHADKNNAQGFDPGAWIPYLTVSYSLRKIGGDWSAVGTMMAMTANDGPHYGANVKFDGPGKYRLQVSILPPPYAGFLRHTDKETGVAPWWAPIQENWDFVYTGVGHKGAY